MNVVQYFGIVDWLLIGGACAVVAWVVQMAVQNGGRNG